MLVLVCVDVCFFFLLFAVSWEQVFKNCKAGSVLKNVAFEITDSQGEVDETIHDEEKHGQSHILKIMSKSLCIDDSVKYRFHHGRCTIPSIPLPDKGGPVFFSASHSRYPELKSTIEVGSKSRKKFLLNMVWYFNNHA